VQVYCPVDDLDPPGDAEAGGPSIWLGRSDYTVKAYDTARRRELWNMSYAELAAPELSVLEPRSTGEDASGASAHRAAQAAAEWAQSLHTLDASMHGHLVATDAKTGAWVWQSQRLSAPVVSVHAIRVTAGHPVALPVHFTEHWPVQPARLPTSAGDGGEDGRPLPEPLPSMQVYVGMLPGGQLFAAPKARNTVYSQTPQDGELGALQLAAGGEYDVSALPRLPAPGADGNGGLDAGTDMQLGVGGHLVRTGGPAGVCAVDVGGATALTAQCMVGVHNVSYVADPSVPLPLPGRQWVEAARQASAGASGGNAPANVVIQLPQQTGALAAVARAAVRAVYGREAAGDAGLVERALTLVYAVAGLAAAAVAGAVVAQRAMARREAAAASAGSDGAGSRTGAGRGARKARRGANTSPTADSDGATPESTTAGLASDASPAGLELVAAARPQPRTETTITDADGTTHRAIGRLTISDAALGYGCHGTVVFAGRFDSRPVAVKRMLKTFHPAAAREVSLLIRSDGHPNVVRYFACEEAEDFVYLALELCDGTLADAVARCAHARRRAAARLANGGKAGGSGGKVAATPQRKAQTVTAAAMALLDDDDEHDTGAESDAPVGMQAPVAATPPEFPRCPSLCPRRPPAPSCVSWCPVWPTCTLTASCTAT
jgi:hypothetical protein